MPKPDVLVAAKFPPYLMGRLQQDFTVHDRLHETDPAAFERVAPTIRAIACGGESRVPRALLDKLPKLEMVSVMGVGYDGVDVAAAVERGVPVSHTPNVLNDDVADLAIALMLSVARRIPQADRFVRAGSWSAGAFPLARKMSGARLGIAGMGRIGKAIAHRGEAFGMSIAYTARSEKKDLAYRFYPSVAALAAQVDFLVVITPGGAGTAKMINREVLDALGPNGYLVNVARGSVVDQEALIDALKEGRIAGAGLDVFDGEPQVPQALRDLDNVVLTPHIGSGTDATRQAMADLAHKNLVAHFAGQPLPSAVPECQVMAKAR